MLSNELKNKIRDIGKKYDLKSIFVFGSYSRNEEKSDSDIDLHINTKSPISLIKHSNILADFREILNTETDLIVNDCCDDEMIQNIKKDEILLYEG